MFSVVLTLAWPGSPRKVGTNGLSVMAPSYHSDKNGTVTDITTAYRLLLPQGSDIMAAESNQAAPGLASRQ